MDMTDTDNQLAQEIQKHSPEEIAWLRKFARILVEQVQSDIAAGIVRPNHHEELEQT